MTRTEHLRVTREGIEGDRYRQDSGQGFWRGKGDSALTLIAVADVLDAAAELGTPIDPVALRRNVVTDGVTLTSLIGARFRIGEALLEGERPCDPCMRLERHLGVSGLKAALRGRGGLRAVVVEGGLVRVGDPVVDVGPDA